MDTITLPQTLFTVQDLMTLGGIVVAVYVIVSFFKDPLKKLGQKYSSDGTGDWVVRPFTVLVALAILMWLIFIQGTVTTEAIGLAIINAFLVALIAGAAHDYVVAPTKKKTEQLTPLEGAELKTMEFDTDGIAAKVAAAIKTGDRGEEPPSIG